MYELRRAREWTAALTRWCEQQPDMVAHTGVCLVHRAEIMELTGAWGEALEEARRAHTGAWRSALGAPDHSTAGHDCYREGELHRLRGDFARAEEAFIEASKRGWEPQPCLALMRLAQGRGKAAAGAIRRALGETSEPLARLSLLPAYVEIMLAAGDGESARAACGELDAISKRYQTSFLEATSAHARGALALAEGDPRRALSALRCAFRLWNAAAVDRT